MAVHGQLLRARHLFPRIVALWINFRRGLLRLRWGVSAVAHFPDLVAQGVERLGSLVGLSFVGLGTLFSKIGDFFKNFGEHLSALWAGMWHFLSIPLRIRFVPTWTTGAAAGTVGVMLTILLFLAPREAQPRAVPAPRLLTTPPDEMSPPREQHDAEPAMPTLAPQSSIPDHADWRHSGAELALRWSRLTFPRRWDQREIIMVKSTPLRSQRPAFDAFAVRDLWREADRLRPLDRPAFAAYIKKIDTPRAASPLNALASSDTIDPRLHADAARRAGVIVEKRAPASAVAQRPFEYQLIVRNIGQEAVEQVVVREQVSSIERVVMTTPPAAVTSDRRLQWELNRLEPGAARELWVTLLPDHPEVARSRATVELTTRIAAVTTVKPPAPEPPHTAEPAVFIPEDSRPMPIPLVEPQRSPQLTMRAQASPSVRSGDVFSAVYEIKNTGDAPATSIVLTVAIPPKLDHRHGGRVEHRIRSLAPGKTHRARFAARAKEAGTAKLNAELSSAEQARGRNATTIRIQPQPRATTAACPPRRAGDVSPPINR